jgi:hypothetical protein
MAIPNNRSTRQLFPRAGKRAFETS